MLVLVFPFTSWKRAALDVHVAAGSADTELVRDNKESQHDFPKEEKNRRLIICLLKRQIPVCLYARH